MTFLVDVDSFNGVEGEGGVVGGQKNVHSNTRDWRLLVSLNSHHQLLYSTRWLLLSGSNLWLAIRINYVWHFTLFQFVSTVNFNIFEHIFYTVSVKIYIRWSLSLSAFK